MEALKRIQKDVDSAVKGYEKLRGGVWEAEQVPKNAIKVIRDETRNHTTGHSSLGTRVKLLAISQPVSLT